MKTLKIKGITLNTPIIQGGMGVGVSLYPLAKAVAKEGGLGVISSACLDRIVSKRIGKRVNIYEAVLNEVSEAKKEGGFVGINIMVALMRDYKDSVIAAIDAKTDAIISGAGLPLALPSIYKPGDTALIPIVSSARALDIICKRWQKAGYRPDAVVLEGPLAGGHLGFSVEQIDNQDYSLEKLLPPVKELAMKNGDFPVIVAGGIYSNSDIKKFLKMGADGVQMGTRFLATYESSADELYKQAVLKATKNDILVAVKPGSPCGLPFRVLKDSPMFVSAQKALRKPKCNKGYVLTKDEKGNYTVCPAKVDNVNYFCICNGLLSSAGYNPTEEEPLYTVGTNAYRIDKILSVKELMDELCHPNQPD
ncbi:MAG TPA: nitronate monooxygenase [Nitrospirae bacterium]|nr:nitronate monooxygenase [Nitrospirota bacterium]